MCKWQCLVLAHAFLRAPLSGTCLESSFSASCDPISPSHTCAHVTDTRAYQQVTPRDDPKTRARFLADTYNWDAGDARKIWCFGPDAKGANVIVDMTKGIANMNEVKDSFVAAWQWATKASVVFFTPWRFSPRDHCGGYVVSHVSSVESLHLKSNLSPFWSL